MKADFLKINDTYISIQGEGLHTGLLCFFIRTAGCDLRCTWCDSISALTASKEDLISIADIVKKIPEDIPLIQITGGEPLIQKVGVLALVEEIHNNNPEQKILLETGGHLSIENVPDFVHIVMDVKLESSNESKHDFANNFISLKKTDEVKFVVADENDYIQTKSWIEKYSLYKICNVLISPVWGKMPIETLADWIIQDALSIRFQLQLHKNIWGNKEGI